MDDGVTWTRPYSRLLCLFYYHVCLFLPVPLLLSLFLKPLFHLLSVPPMDRKWGTQIGVRTDFKTSAVTINSSPQPSCWVCWELALICYADPANGWPWFYQDRSRSHRNQQDITLPLNTCVVHPSSCSDLASINHSVVAVMRSRWSLPSNQRQQ